METKWSNEKTVAEHKDIEADVMCINHSGKYVALANPRMLYVIDIDNSSQISRSISRTSKWDVTASEWSPHKEHLLSLSYYNFVAIYSLRGKCSISSITRLVTQNALTHIYLLLQTYFTMTLLRRITEDSQEIKILSSY